MDGNPSRLTLDQPLDVDDARKAARRLAELRRDAEDQHQRSIEKAADAEAAYRRAYAEAFVQAQGTAAEREAVARSEASKQGRERDIGTGMVKVFAERLKGLEGERSMLKSLMDWSARMEERLPPSEQPQWGLRGQSRRGEAA